MNPRALYGRRAALFAGLLATLLSACAGSPSRYPVPALPVSKLEQLRADALRALPPDENGEFLDTDLVEVFTLDPSLRLDVRYAGSDNFLRAPIYPEARVFLQRPAAEAVVRAAQSRASVVSVARSMDGRCAMRVAPPPSRLMMVMAG